MIKLTTISSTGLRAHYVAPGNVAGIAEAGPNDRGVRSYVRLFTGQMLECGDTAAQVNNAIEKDSRK